MLSAWLPRASAFLPRIECFDAALLGVGEAECAWLAPQQRCLLEAAWRSLASLPPAAQLCADSGVWVGGWPSLVQGGLRPRAELHLRATTGTRSAWLKPQALEVTARRPFRPPPIHPHFAVVCVHS